MTGINKMELNVINLKEPSEKLVKMFTEYKTEEILEEIDLKTTKETSRNFFDSKFGKLERDDKKLEKVFGNPNGNILFKVLLLDKLYGTQILNPIDLADAISEIEVPKEVSAKTVNKIADWRGGNSDIEGRREYSFATKYCHFCNPEYPIYDSFVKSLLYAYNENYHFFKCSWKNENEAEIALKKDYETFYGFYRSFRNFEKFGLKNCSVKEIDIFLWTYGKYLKVYGA